MEPQRYLSGSRGNSQLKGPEWVCVICSRSTKVVGVVTVV